MYIEINEYFLEKYYSLYKSIVIYYRLHSVFNSKDKIGLDTKTKQKNYIYFAKKIVQIFNFNLYRLLYFKRIFKRDIF